MAKWFTLTVLLFVGSNVWAQYPPEAARVSAKAPAASPQSGFQIGATYANLTKLFRKVKANEATQLIDSGPEEIDSMNLGMTGLRLSYLGNLQPGIFLEPGLFFQHWTSGSEVEQNFAGKMSLYGADANVVFQSDLGFNAYFGLLFSRIEPQASLVQYRFSPGLQLGLGYRIDGVSIRAGYAHYQVKGTGKLTGLVENEVVEWEEEGNISGFTAQIAYVF